MTIFLPWVQNFGSKELFCLEYYIIAVTETYKRVLWSRCLGMYLVTVCEMQYLQIGSTNVSPNRAEHCCHHIIFEAKLIPQNANYLQKKTI
jgi:hypothetical protein